MKDCPLTKISSQPPEICLNALLSGMSIPTHGHSGRQNPSGTSWVYGQSGV